MVEPMWVRMRGKYRIFRVFSRTVRFLLIVRAFGALAATAVASWDRFFACAIISTALTSISTLTAWFFIWWFWFFWFFWFVFSAGTATVASRNRFFTGTVISAALAAVATLAAWAIVLTFPVAGIAVRIPDKI